MAQAPPLTLIFHGKTSAPIGRTDLTRLAFSFLRSCVLGSYPADMDSSPLSPDDFRAAAEVYRELGPDYGEAVAQSFIDQVNREIVARAAAEASRAQQPAQVSKLHKHRPPVSGLASGAVVSAVSLISVLTLMHGSAAARADWYQWLLGALLVSVVVSVGVAAARKVQINGRLAK